MQCQQCGGEVVRTLEGFPDKDTGNQVRVRKCLICGYAWATEEIFRRPIKVADLERRLSELERKTRCNCPGDAEPPASWCCPVHGRVLMVALVR